MRQLWMSTQDYPSPERRANVVEMCIGSGDGGMKKQSICLTTQPDIIDNQPFFIPPSRCPTHNVVVMCRFGPRFLYLPDFRASVVTGG